MVRRTRGKQEVLVEEMLRALRMVGVLRQTLAVAVKMPETGAATMEMNLRTKGP